VTTTVLLSCLLAAFAIVGDATGDGGVALTEPAVVWIHTESGTGYTPALADGGTLAVSVSGSAGLLLYSSFATSPPESLMPAGDLWLMGSAAAREGDLLLSTSIEIVTPFSAIGFLHAYRPGSEAPLWSFPYEEQFWPVPGFDLSSSGDVVVSLQANEAQGALELRTHDVSTGAVTAFHSYTGWPITNGANDLSADGGVFACSHTDGTGMARLLNPRTGALLLETPGSLPRHQALSADGSRVTVRENLAENGWRVRVLADDGAGYDTVLELSSVASEAPADFALSDDGSVLAVGFYDLLNAPTSCRIEAWDVDTGTLRLVRSFGGGPDLGLDNPLSDVALSDDGARLAVGIWGLAEPALAELQVFDTTTDSLAAAFPAGGTVFALDIAPDGQRVLASRIPNHAQQGHVVKRLQLYDMGGDDLVLSGSPTLGAEVAFGVHGAPGADAWLLVAAALAPTPLPVGGAGELLLDPDAFLTLPWGEVDADGVLTRNVVLPADVALLGLDLYVQGATTGPLRMGVTALRFALLP
jgi:hypothetical protein